MSKLMRCLFCGLLQDEPKGVKTCARCGGELAFEQAPPSRAYVQAQMELDQINAPADQVVERHLVVTIRTPAQVPDGETAPTTSGREPMGFTAVLDVSGSMRGEKVEAAKEGVRQGVHRLHDGDAFSLVTFADEARTILDPTRVDGKLRKQVESILREVSAGGMTALCEGLETGIRAAAAGRRETNLVLLLSDGQANVGETDLELIGSRASQARGEGIVTSSIGVGGDYNEALMVEIANQGGGRFYHVLHAHQLAAHMAGELGEISALAARGATLYLTLPDGTGIETFSPAYTVGAQSAVNLGDIPVDTKLEVVLRLLLPAQSAGVRLPIEGRLAYRSPAGNELTTPLNVVTVHFVALDLYDRRKSAVIPVVERVLEQMRARSVLGTARTAAFRGRAAADRAVELDVDKLRSYASLMGDEAAEDVATEHEAFYAAMAAVPLAQKQAVDKHYARLRGTKDFDEKRRG